MAGPVQSLECWVLGKRPPSDSFQTLTLFSATTGVVLALQRLSKKSTQPSLDLFDLAAVLAETPPTGSALFLKETRIISRFSEIGRSYENLRLASRLATLIARNPVGEESRPLIQELLGQAFGAFASSTRPDIVYLKSTYRFFRDEGYPLKQDWAPTLPLPDRTALAALLNQPIAGQNEDPKVVARLQRKMEDYLRENTEFLLD